MKIVTFTVFFCFIATALGYGESNRLTKKDPFDLLKTVRGSGKELTVTEAQKMALAWSPDIEKSRAAIVLVEAAASQSLVAAMPRLEFSGRYTRLSAVKNGSFYNDDPQVFTQARALAAQVTDPAARTLWQNSIDSQEATANFSFPIFFDQYALRATVKFPVSEILLSALPAYRASISAEEAEQHRLKSQSAQIALNVAESYFNFARARGAHAVAMRARKSAEDRRNQIEAFVNGGRMAKLDLKRAQAQLARAQLAETRARASEVLGAEGLCILLHYQPCSQIMIAERFEANPSPLEGDKEKFLKLAYHNRPEIKAIKATIKTQKHIVSAQRGLQYPKLDLSANMDYANPNTRIFPQQQKFRATWDVNAVLSWSPNDTFSASATTSQAEADLMRAGGAFRAVNDAVSLEITQAVTAHETARTSLAVAQEGLEAAKESYRARVLQFEVGVAVLSDVLDADTELSQAYLDLLNAHIDLRIAWFRLQYATGTMKL
ncbi:MAG: TolC family protein [Myxococcales bacterium]|nr:MAG: TolC family protein [Myxococcales bacterium]